MKTAIPSSILAAGIYLMTAFLFPVFAYAVQVQFVNNLQAFPSTNIDWYRDGYFECSSPSGGRTCSSELSEGYYDFDVRDANGNILCRWKNFYVDASDSSNRLVYPNRRCG